MNETATATTLREYMTTYSNVSLAKLAESCNVSYAMVRSKAKLPVEGQVFDPEFVNYEAIEAYLQKKNEQLNLGSLDWEALNTKSSKGTRVLKDSSIDFSVGCSYYLRYFKQVWTIVYETQTHVCIMPADGSTTVPKVMAKTTFVSCGVKPADYQPAQVAESKSEE